MVSLWMVPPRLKVHRPEHWVFRKTGIRQGDEFGGKDTIVGYECDGCQFEMKDGLPVPTFKDGTPKTFQILATCPAKWAPGDSLWYDHFDKDRIGAAILGMYTRGGTVLTVGSTDWAHGLRGKDPDRPTDHQKHSRPFIKVKFNPAEFHPIPVVSYCRAHGVCSGSFSC